MVGSAKWSQCDFPAPFFQHGNWGVCVYRWRNECDQRRISIVAIVILLMMCMLWISDPSMQPKLVAHALHVRNGISDRI